MISHGQVQPVRLQGVVDSPEHRSDVGGVLAGGVEVSVVTDLRGEVHRHGVETERERTKRR